MDIIKEPNGDKWQQLEIFPEEVVERLPETDNGREEDRLKWLHKEYCILPEEDCKYV